MTGKAASGCAGVRAGGRRIIRRPACAPARHRPRAGHGEVSMVTGADMSILTGST
jgi:hypothetical protein